MRDKPETVEMELNPVRRPKLTTAEIYSLKAVTLGTATPQAQILCMETILLKLCRPYDIPYRKDRTQQDMVIGGQIIGKHIISYVNIESQGLNLDKLSIEQLGLTEQNDES